MASARLDGLQRRVKHIRAYDEMILNVVTLLGHNAKGRRQRHIATVERLMPWLQRLIASSPRYSIYAQWVQQKETGRLERKKSGALPEEAFAPVDMGGLPSVSRMPALDDEERERLRRIREEAGRGAEPRGEPEQS